MSEQHRTLDADVQTSRRKALCREIGQRIVQRREELGWSQADLAKRLQVERTRVSRWETGLHSPPLEDLPALSQALRTTLDELITGHQPSIETLTVAQKKAGARYLNGLATLLQLQSSKK
jgi:transcriptional regulator with XRE-family HTH domain